MINEFQLTLIGAGVLAVIAVWGYNFWQERRARKVADKVFRSVQADVLLEQDSAEDIPGEITSAVEPGRVEPVLERIEPRIEAVENASPDAAADAGESALPDESLSDPVTEVAIAVYLDSARQARPLWQVLQTLPARVATRVRLIGLREGAWHEIHSDDVHAYEQFRAQLQLADRKGPMGGDELAVFAQAVDAWAADNGGSTTVPPLDDVAHHARALDDFCAGMDIQMAVHVVSRSGSEFAGTKLRSLMEAAGFELRSDGLFHLSDEAGGTALSVSNFGAAPFVADELKQLATQGVTFWLDVPRVGNGAAVFDRLVATARQLAGAVDGILVDDQRRPLEDKALTSIRAKIGEIQQKMAAADLPAGGRRALRLFR